MNKYYLFKNELLEIGRQWCVMGDVSVERFETFFEALDYLNRLCTRKK